MYLFKHVFYCSYLIKIYTFKIKVHTFNYYHSANKMVITSFILSIDVAYDFAVLM